MADNNITIPDELLESISGGKLDEASINNVTAFAKGFKAAGMTLDQALAQFAFASQSDDFDEILKIVRDVYAA